MTIRNNQKGIRIPILILSCVAFTCGTLVPFTSNLTFVTTVGMLGITFPQQTPYQDTPNNRNKMAQAAVVQHQPQVTSTALQGAVQDLTNNSNVINEIGSILQKKEFQFQTKRAAIICTVPLVLHGYATASTILFDTALEKLDSNNTPHRIVKVIRDINHWVAISPVTQIALTQLVLSHLKRQHS